MKSKLILTCAMVTISLCLLTCSPATKQVSVGASRDDFMKLHPECTISKQVEVAVGDPLTVTLESNWTTGFKWELTELTDQTVLELVESKYELSKEARQDPPVPGAGGKEIWEFKALKEGKSTISMEYSQPWEGGTKAAWTFVLTVVVK